MNNNQFPKSTGNINQIGDFSVENATVTNLTVTNINDGSLVTASSNLGATDVIVGNSGAKDVKSTGVTIDGSNNMIIPGTLTTNTLQSNTGQQLNIYSASGQNINIDANNGVIVSNTLNQLGVQLIQNSSSPASWIAQCIRNGPTGQLLIVQGIINSSGEDHPTIGVNYGYPTPSSWSPLYLNNGAAGADPIVIGNNITIAQTLASNAVLYARGKYSK